MTGMNTGGSVMNTGKSGAARSGSCESQEEEMTKSTQDSAVDIMERFTDAAEAALTKPVPFKFLGRTFTTRRLEDGTQEIFDSAGKLVGVGNHPAFRHIRPEGNKTE